MNLWLPNADISIIASMIIYAWKKGLKTLCYYLHIRAAADTLAYTVAPEVLFKKMMKNEEEEDERYRVTTTLDEQSVLNVNVNPLHLEDESLVVAKRKREEQNEECEDDDDILICPYSPGNPNKKGCTFGCGS